MVLKSKVRISSILFRFVVILLTAAVAFLAIGLIGYLLKKGLPYVNRAFLFTEPDILMDSYGIKPMIINTIYTVVLTLIFCIPLGIGSAIYLAEYAKQGKIVSGIRFAIEILAGIPSIVYGLFGLNFFVRKMAIGDYAGSMLAASLTLTLIVLPTMIRTTEESLLAVSQTYREAAIATGMSKFYMIRKIILPCAISGIVVAIILSIGRMVSESAVHGRNCTGFTVVCDVTCDGTGSNYDGSALFICNRRWCTGMGAVCDGSSAYGICFVY